MLVEPDAGVGLGHDRCERGLADLKVATQPPRSRSLQARPVAARQAVAAIRARADLGIVASRANAGGVHAVQWSLPG